MQEKTVFIVDSDLQYVIPFVRRFAEIGNKNIKLNVITDPECFRKLLLSPRQMDLLIISDDMYDNNIIRHPIKKILLLTEQKEGNDNNYDHIISAWKYDSFRELFSLIESRTFNLFADDKETGENTTVITVSSASGGCGKTVVSMALCERLSIEHKEVLYIDAEELQTFLFYLFENGYTQPVLGTKDICSYMKYDQQPKVFDFCSELKEPRTTLGLPDDYFKKLIQMAKQSGDYDYIIVDTDHVFSESKSMLLAESDFVLLLAGTDKYSLHVLSRFMENINDIGSNKYLLFLNCIKEDDSVNQAISSSHLQIDGVIEHMYYKNHISLAELADTEGIKKLAMMVQ